MNREVFKPNPEFSKNARIKNMCEYQELQDFATRDYEGFWGSYAKEKLEWMEPFHTVLDESNYPFVKWWGPSFYLFFPQKVNN